MNQPTPFAHVLHEATIAKLARGPALARGQAYFAERRVTSLSLVSGRLFGEVVGTKRYETTIWVTGDRLGYVCSCPSGSDGNFCKHCVAVAIAWLESQKAQTYTPKQGQYLAYIYYYTKLNGRPPSEADMQAYFGVSPPVVHEMVKALENRGFIARTPRTARSIRLLLERSQLPDLE